MRGVPPIRTEKARPFPWLLSTVIMVVVVAPAYFMYRSTLSTCFACWDRVTDFGWVAIIPSEETTYKVCMITVGQSEGES